MQRWDGLLLLYPLCFVNRMSLAHWALARANLVWPSNSAGHFQSQGPFSEGRFFISVPARSFVSRFTLICLSCLLLRPRSSASPSGWKGDKIPGGSSTALAGSVGDVCLLRAPEQPERLGKSQPPEVSQGGFDPGLAASLAGQAGQNSWQGRIEWRNTSSGSRDLE